MDFVSVEGIDGSGKSTVVDAIQGEYLDTITTSEPSELWTGGQVRRCLSDSDTDPLTDFYFFMGDRVHHIEQKIRTMVENGQFVVSDRYADSTRAYQPVALAQSQHFESQADAKLFLERTMHPWNYEPDITFYIDVSVDTALKRCDESEKYETREFLEKVKANYDELIEDESERFVVIDGEKSKKSVRQDVLGKL